MERLSLLAASEASRNPGRRSRRASGRKHSCQLAPQVPDEREARSPGEPISPHAERYKLVGVGVADILPCGEVECRPHCRRPWATPVPSPPGTNSESEHLESGRLRVAGGWCLEPLRPGRRGIDHRPPYPANQRCGSSPAPILAHSSCALLRNPVKYI